MFILNLKRYIKTTAIFFATIMYIVIIGFMCKNGFSSAEGAFATCLKLGQISFLFFLFVSYEFFSKLRRDKMEEVVAGISFGKRKMDLSGLGMLALFDATVCLAFFLYTFFAALHNGIHNTNYTIFLGVSIIEHHFLVYLFAILLGFGFSKVKSDIKGYFLLVMTYILFGSRTIGTIHQLSYGKEFLYRFSDLLSIYIRDFSAISDFYYIYSIEAVNLQRILFWIFMVLFVLMVTLYHGWKKWISVGAFSCALLCAVLFFQPTSAVNLDNDISGQDALTADDVYYQLNDCMNTSQYKEANFRVTKYEAEFSMERQLEAQIAVYVDKTDLKKYYFTLYHGYQVEQVMNQDGDELEFQQEKDYITVENTTDKKIDFIKFTYSGSCKRFYSTSQGVFLPAYLAYYPMPGCRQVYIRQNGYWGNAIDGLGYETEFDVTVHTKTKLFSNLDVKEGKRLSGKSDGLTLLASDFAGEKIINGCRIIYPLLAIDSIRPDFCQEEFEAFVSDYSLEQKTIIIPPYINGTFYYFGAEHFIGELQTLKERYEVYRTSGELYDYISEEELTEYSEKNEIEE